jgi:hypothetical protein
VLAVSKIRKIGDFKYFFCVKATILYFIRQANAQWLKANSHKKEVPLRGMNGKGTCFRNLKNLYSKN